MANSPRTTLQLFRAFLIAWTAVILGLWVMVGLHNHFGVPKDPARGFHLWKIWNGYYSGVWGAGIFFVPAITFHVWAARRFGVNAAYAYMLFMRLIAVSACATFAFLAFAAARDYRPHLAGLGSGDAWWLALATVATGVVTWVSFARPAPFATASRWFLGLCLLASVVQSVRAGSLLSSWALLVVSLVALLWLGMVGSREEERGSLVGGAIVVVSIGGALWGIGNLIWFWINTCTFWPSALDCSKSLEVPYPSWADAGYLAILPTAAIALLMLTRVLGLRRGDVLAFWPLPLVVLAVTGYFSLSSQSIVHDVFGFRYGKSYLVSADYTWFAKFVSYIYVASDTLLLSLSIVLLLGARRRAGGVFFWPLAWISTSMMMLFIGDFFFFQRVANSTFYNGDFSDMLYGIFTVTMAMGVYAFASAEVRTAEELDLASQQAPPEIDDDDEDDAEDRGTPHEQLATAIVAGQRGVIGAEPADDAARRVDGLTVDRDGKVHVREGSDGADAVERLVQVYSSISGPLGERLCWAAARPVLTRHPELHVAAFERFGGQVQAERPAAAAR